MTQGGRPGIRSGIGSVILMDSAVINTETVVLLNSALPPNANDTSNTLLLDNLKLVNISKSVAASAGKVLLAGGTNTISSFARGSRYTDTSGSGQYATDENVSVRKNKSLLDRQGKFFEKTRPQYEHLSAKHFASVKGIKFRLGALIKNYMASFWSLVFR